MHNIILIQFNLALFDSFCLKYYNTASQRVILMCDQNEYLTTLILQDLLRVVVILSVITNCSFKLKYVNSYITSGCYLYLKRYSIFILSPCTRNGCCDTDCRLEVCTYTYMVAYLPPVSRNSSRVLSLYWKGI